MNRFPEEGVEVWINPTNQFLCFQLHYSANPVKRDPGYRDSIKNSMPRAQYMQEYELQWDSFSGLPVYQDFSAAVHGSKEPLTAEVGLPLLRGWDFGLTPACVVGQLQGDTLVILWEMVSQNMGIKKFSKLALQECAIRFPEWSDSKRDWRDYADPAGSARKDTDEGTCFKILGDPKGANLRVFPGPVAFEARKEAVESFLTSQTKAGPNFKIDMQACPVLTRGFKGGYRYPEKCDEVEPSKIRPLKDEHSHPHDALQYLASGVARIQAPKRPRIPDPRYTFSMAQGDTR